LRPITRFLLVRDARTKEELAHGVLKGQNDRLDISVMDAKEPRTRTWPAYCRPGQAGI